MKRKPKYVTMQTPWEEVKPGDQLECPGGFDGHRRILDTVLSVEPVDNNYVMVRFQRQGSVVYQEIVKFALCEDCIYFSAYGQLENLWEDEFTVLHVIDCKT